MKNNIKIASFTITMLLLIAPLIQRVLPLVKVKPLSGAIELPDTDSLTFNSWFSGSYQNKLNDFTEFEIGFRPWFVRARNQVMYSVFHQSTSYVELGKEGQLYTWGYFEAYAGLDCLGDQKVKDIAYQIKALQNALSKRNKHLLVVIAPNKARLLPDYLPEKYSKYTLATSNYDLFLKQFNELEINHIDFNAFFLSQKKSEYPIFPQTGIHWSTYGAEVAANEIIKKLPLLSGEALPHLNWNNVVLKDSVVGSDTDLENDLNLFFELDRYKLAYPNLEPTELKEEQKIPGLVISDSFYWNFYTFNFPSEFMRNNSKFLFYNNTAYDQYQNSMPADELNMAKEIDENKYFILMTTEANFSKFPFGFIDDTRPFLAIDDEIFDLKKAKAKERKLELVQHFIKEIGKDEIWKKSIREKALAKGITFEEMVELDAIYLANEEYEKELKKLEVEDIVREIKKSESWLKQVEQKAVIRGVSLEEMLILDAEYVLDQKANK